MFCKSQGLTVALFLFLFSWTARAQVQIPRNLNSGDRQALLQVLGYGSMSKILGDPYPLGGYSGVEVSVQNDVIPTSTLQRMGTGTSMQQSDLSYFSLVFGKGLYNHFDVHLQMLPSQQLENVSGFAGQLRWGFFESENKPWNVTMVLHAGSMNFQNLLVTNTQGLDLVSGYSVDDLTVYGGVGVVRAQGVFLGGAVSLTDREESAVAPDGASGQRYKQTLQESLTDFRYLAGVNFKMGPSFIALELDRVAQTSFSAKFGFRF